MRYYKTSKFPKFVGSAGFYAIIALCLLGIGAASWFAVSRYNSMSENQGGTNSPDNAYEAPQSSYNDNTEIPQAVEPEVSTDVENTVSDVPYSEPETTSQAPAEEKRSFILPVDGNVLKGYSDSALQYSATHSDMRLHTGIDIIAADGTDIKAAGSGTVTAVEESATLGRAITIDHGDGIVIKYCGMASVNVKAQDSVRAGTVIGTLGTVPAECADQSHLHIEATLDGEVVSPLTALGLD